MLNNIKNHKFNNNYFIKTIFNIFPLIMLMPSAYITAYSTFFIIYSCIFLFINKIKIKIFFTDYLIFIFFLSSIISTILSYGNSNFIILAKSISDIRFAILFLLIRNLFFYKIIRINTLLTLSFVCVIFLSLDILLQFIYGKDILGYTIIDGRYGGIFGKEAIAGSYIQKFSILAILASCYFKFKNNQKKRWLIFFTIILLGTGILMTLDRAPFFIYILSLFLLFILFKNYRIIIFSSLITIIILFSIMYKNNNLVQHRYGPIYLNAKIIILEITNLITKEKKSNEHPFSVQEMTMQTGIEYFKLFNSAIYTFKNNFWIGSGSKSFYKSCNELIKYRKDLLCAPHPHNIYLEILINQGIVGIVIFFIFLLSILKKYYLDLIATKKNNFEKILILSFFIIFIAELWPLRSYGSIFQTVNGTLFWFLISLTSSKLLAK
jgi:O-antigen ligase